MHWLQWPGSTSRSCKQSVSFDGNGPVSGPLFFQTDSSFQMRIMDASVQCWSNLRIKYFKFWNYSCKWRGYLIIHWINHLHFLEAMQVSVETCEQLHTSLLNLIFHQANVAGEGNLSICRYILQSLFTFTIFFEESPPLKITEFLAHCSDWHLRSWFCSGLWLFTTVDEWSGSSVLELHGFNSCG